MRGEFFSHYFYGGGKIVQISFKKIGIFKKSKNKY